MSLSSHLLYTAPPPAPNPRRVHLFLRERGLESQLPSTSIDLSKAEQKSPSHVARNVMGQIPTLSLPNGGHISESVSICRYLDSAFPAGASGPHLFGSIPEEIAIIDSWIRRVEMRVMAPLGVVWVNVHPYTKPYAERMKMKRFEDFGEENKTRYLASLKWLDGLFSENGGFVAGLDSNVLGFSMADIILLTTVDFGSFVGLPIPKEMAGLTEWHARVSARPSVMVEKGKKRTKL